MRNRIAAITAFVAIGGPVAVAAGNALDQPATVSITAERLTGDATVGNPGGGTLPTTAAPSDTSRPDHVIGTGTPVR